MKKIFPLSLLLLIIFAVSCSSPDSNDISEQEQNVILNNSNLANRLKEGNLGVISIKEAPEVIL